MTSTAPAASGELVRNLMIFVRLLREAGLRVGPERALVATEALAIIGIEQREDVRSALAGVLVDAPEHRPVFDALFDAIFQPGLMEQALLGRAGLPPCQELVIEARQIAAAIDRFPAPIAALQQAFTGTTIKLASGNPKKIAALNAAGYKVQRVKLDVEMTPEREAYLKHKKDHLGHIDDD